MSLGVGIGDLITVVNIGLDVYKKIKDREEPIIDIVNRLKSLQRYLVPLKKDFVDTKNALTGLRPDQTATLNAIIGEIQEEVEKVNVILEKWEKKSGIGGLEYRDFVRQTWFALGGGPGQLAKLAESLDRKQAELDRQIILMSGFGIGAVLAQGKPPNGPVGVPKMLDVVSILFLDSVNESRSVVSMVYAQLLREWTQRKNTTWRIAQMHSAGLIVKSLSQIVAVQESLKVDMYHGGMPPNEVALAALFDKETSVSLQRRKIKESVYQHKSRGLDRAMFTRYNYLIFFNRSDIVTVERLREAMRERGIETVEEGKGKTILLGEYGPSKYSEIWEPRTDDKANPQYRADWDRTVWNIKASFRGFLKKELGWIEPTWHAGSN